MNGYKLLRKDSPSGVRPLSTLVFLVIGTASSVLPPAEAISNESGERSGVSSELTSPLKTRIPDAESRKAPIYLKEFQGSQQPKSLTGNATAEVPLQRVELPSPSQTSRIVPPVTSPSVDTSVPLKRPPLTALISVQESMNPFSLDANYIQSIGLGDALRASLGQNLDIQSNYASLRTQKYTYLSSLTKFLPDINSGYSLIGLHGSFPSSLFGNNTTSSSSALGSTSTTSSQSNLPAYAQVLNAGFNYNLYKGGSIVFGASEQKHRFRAARASLRGEVNDVLLDAARRYYDLIYNEALLEIRTRAVDISEEQVRMNTLQERAGTATGLDVLQSQAQLASDQSNLVDQQNNRRQAAIKLAHVLNSSFLQDIVTSDTMLDRKRVIQKNIDISHLLAIAVDKRPELRQYEELRLAAKRAIVVAGAPLQPSASLGGTVYGIGSKGSSMDSIFLLNFGVKWNLGGLGLTDSANIQRARWVARQASIDAKREFQTVFEEVHTSYDQSLAADKRIDFASAQIAASLEELRIAKKRMDAGIGLNIDVLNAQRDFTQARINKARAVIDFNVAQAQLLRDTGLISYDSLTRGATL